MSIPELYATATGASPFGFEGYRTTREYLDPRKSLEAKRSPTRRKSLSDLGHPFKPNFIDQQIKQFKHTPAPNAYNVEQSILRTIRNKVIPRINKKITKDTYIDKIITNQLKRSTPGIGKYNLVKPFLEEKRFKSKGQTSERWTKFDQMAVIGRDTPGAGRYEVKSLWGDAKQPLKTQEMFGDKKSQSEKVLRTKKSKLGPGAYNPIPCNYSTFQRISRSKSEKRMSLWDRGTVEKRKSEFKSLRPGPADYDMTETWGRVKNQILQKKKIEKISCGPTKLIYY